MCMRMGQVRVLGRVRVVLLKRRETPSDCRPGCGGVRNLGDEQHDGQYREHDHGQD